MTRQRIEKLLEMARTSGALTEAMKNPDPQVMPPLLKERCEARVKDLEYMIERYLIEEA